MAPSTATGRWHTQRQGSKFQGHRPQEGPVHLQKRPWKMGWFWLHCSRVCLRNESASFLSTRHIHYSSMVAGDCSPSPRYPLLALSATWRQTHGAPEGSWPQHSISAAGETWSRNFPLPGSFPPALLGQNRKKDQMGTSQKTMSF